jgi:hypothetical protein
MAEWGPSGVTEAKIRRMEENGLVPEGVLAIGWRSPGIGELMPTPRNKEIISVTTFHRLGLDLPLHPFVRGLMFLYGL